MTLSEAVAVLNHEEHRDSSSWEIIELPSGGAFVIGSAVMRDPIEVIAIAEYYVRRWGTPAEQKAMQAEWEREAMEVIGLERRQENNQGAGI